MSLISLHPLQNGGQIEVVCTCLVQAGCLSEDRPVGVICEVYYDSWLPPWRIDSTDKAPNGWRVPAKLRWMLQPSKIMSAVLQPSKIIACNVQKFSPSLKLTTKEVSSDAFPNNLQCWRLRQQLHLSVAVCCQHFWHQHPCIGCRQLYTCAVQHSTWRSDRWHWILAPTRCAGAPPPGSLPGV